MMVANSDSNHQKQLFPKPILAALFPRVPFKLFAVGLWKTVRKEGIFQPSYPKIACSCGSTFTRGQEERNYMIWRPATLLPNTSALSHERRLCLQIQHCYEIAGLILSTSFLGAIKLRQKPSSVRPFQTVCCCLLAAGCDWLHRLLIPPLKSKRNDRKSYCATRKHFVFMRTVAVRGVKVI